MNQLSVYYDGACHLCSREVSAYKLKDKENKLRLINIADPSFDAQAEGLSSVAVNKYFHIKTPEGEILKGVPAFVRLWKELKIFKFLGWFCSSQLGSPVVSLFYILFASYIRPVLPKRDCSSGRCDL